MNKLQKTKPIGHIECLINTFKPLSKEITDYGDRYPLNNDRIFMIISGSAGLYRVHDGLLISFAHAPFLLGLAPLSLPSSMSSYCYVRFHYLSNAHEIQVKDAKKLLDKNPARWRDVAFALSYSLHYTAFRDINTINGTAYETIRNKILEVASLPSKNNHNLNLRRYIKSSTKLSWTTINRHIKELLEGGYIKINSGILTRVNKLPKKF